MFNEKTFVLLMTLGYAVKTFKLHYNKDQSRIS